MKEGVIIKGIGGFYDVLASDNQVYRCRPRGIFRKLGITPMVGDRVRITPQSSEHEGALEEILPRKNTLIRPPVANIDNLAVVVAAEQPSPDFYMVDKLIITAERMGISVILLINKIDLAKTDVLKKMKSQYSGSGYPIFCVSGKFGQGIEELSKAMKGITTLAGQSGVGKSTIINRLNPGKKLETGKISAQIKRGRHTTRHVELLILPHGGMVVDTPGFSQLELKDVDPIELQNSYPEFDRYRHECYFNGCLHVSEPNCRVKQAVEEGNVSKERYDRYIHIMEEIKENRRNLW
jgi:ribosome biogenesis GTPase